MTELIPLEILSRYCPSSKWEQLANEWSKARINGWTWERSELRRRISRWGDYNTEPVTLADVEARHIERVVAASSTLGAAAKALGIDAATLYRKRKAKCV